MTSSLSHTHTRDVKMVTMASVNRSITFLNFKYQLSPPWMARCWIDKMTDDSTEDGMLILGDYWMCFICYNLVTYTTSQ